jgi:hypothetical protein
VKYDPHEAPVPDKWLELDESERIELVLEYHRRAREKIPNARMHALIHQIVENQAAMGDQTPVGRVLSRLQSEGLDRHDAVHAVGHVLATHMLTLMEQGAATGGDPNQVYWKQLEQLHAEDWKNIR